MSAPFMQLYVADYLGDTRHLTTEQHGAYLLLLMSMWRAGGWLQNDPRKLARVCGCTASRWSKIQHEVMEFFTPEGDMITNKRLRLELEKAQEKSIKRAEAGTLGGRAKSLKNKDASEANASVLLKHSSDIRYQRVTNVTHIRAPDRFDEFWSAYPVKKAKKAAHTAYLKALKETEHGTLVAAVDAQRGWSEWSDARFIPHAATWLNRGGWADEPKPASDPRKAGQSGAGGNRPQNRSMADLAVENQADRERAYDLPDDGWLSTGSDGVFVRGPDRREQA